MIPIKMLVLDLVLDLALVPVIMLVMMASVTLVHNIPHRIHFSHTA